MTQKIPVIGVRYMDLKAFALVWDRLVGKGGGMDVAVARRAERPTWLNTRTILGVVLVMLAVGLGNRLIAQARVTTGVWTFTSDLPAGTRISASLIEPSEVRLSNETAGNYVPVGTDLVGAVLTRPVAAGELVAEDWLAEGAAAAAGRSITIPASPEHALGGTLRIGDRVDVYATFDAGDIRARTTLLVRNVEVLDVVTSGGLVLDEKSLVGITVALSPAEASRVIFALRTGEIDVIRVESSAGVPPGSTVRSGDVR
jgi:Flp pilus assembly protein CpaB